MGVKLHFLNVGHGDCTIVHFPPRTRPDGELKPERIMMVDIYHHENHDDYDDVIDYYKEHFRDEKGNVKPIFRFICTHPHQDHICGLSKLFNESGIEIANFWDLNHEYKPEQFDEFSSHEDDWQKYEEIREAGDDPKVINVRRETARQKYYDDAEDRIVALSPSLELEKHAHYKDDETKRGNSEVKIDEMSYAILIQVNTRKIILAGDGRATPCWNNIYENCKNDIKGTQILKAGHHGHESGFHEEAVKLMGPVLIVFSNSEVQDDENGAEGLYQGVLPDAKIFKTWRDGAIVITCPYDVKTPMEYPKQN